MKLNFMSEKILEIESLNMDCKRSLDRSIKAYKELVKLKEDYININLKRLSPQEIEEIDFLKFKLLEEIIFTKMDLRDLKGLPSDNLYSELDLLYAKTTGDNYD